MTRENGLARAEDARGSASEAPSDAERMPWKADTDEGNHFVIDNEGDCVALVLEGRKAADLMAASPNMLEALRKFTDHYPSGINPFLDEAYALARAAIAKAENR